MFREHEPGSLTRRGIGVIRGRWVKSPNALHRGDVRGRRDGLYDIVVHRVFAEALTRALLGLQLIMSTGGKWTLDEKN